jgi:hypothetical protein
VEGNQTATVAFLRAEEVATRLAEELKRLDEESQRYSMAATTLGDAGEHLRSLAEAVRITSELTSQAVTAIREVGNPAIIDGLGEVTKSVRGSLAAIERAIGALGNLERLDTVHAEALSQLHATLLEGLGKVSGSLAAIERAIGALGNLERLDTVHAEALSQLHATLLEGLGKMSDKQASRHRLVMAVAICAALLAGAAVLVPILR